MRALELRGNQVEVFGLLSMLRGRNPVRQTPDCTQRYTPAVSTPPAQENRPDQVHSTSRKAPHSWSEPPRAATPEVREAMLAVLPSLRAFAISLTGNRDAADDLVQDAILRAWTNLDKFEPGSSMGAWLFTILRNAFYSDCRKTRREVDDPDGVHAGRLGTPPNQGYSCELQELVEALAKLPPVLREALILVGAQGMTYEEAAQVAAVPSGTLKSRVSRARARLAYLLAIDDSDNGGQDSMTQAALQSAS